MWVILWREVFGRSVCRAGGAVLLPAITGQPDIRTLNLIKAMTISIDLILARDLNM